LQERAIDNKAAFDDQMLLMQTAAAARDDKDTFLQACVTQLEVQIADALVTLQEESNKQNAFEAQSTKDTRLMREGAAAEALVMGLRFAEAKLKQQEAEKRAQAMEDKLTKALAAIPSIQTQATTLEAA